MVRPPPLARLGHDSRRASTEISALNSFEAGQPVSAAFTAASNFALSVPGIRATSSRGLFRDVEAVADLLERDGRGRLQTENSGVGGSTPPTRRLRATLRHTVGARSAAVGAQDSLGFPQQGLDLIPEPRERVRSTFEREAIDLVSEKTQLPRDGGPPGL